MTVVERLGTVILVIFSGALMLGLLFELCPWIWRLSISGQFENPWKPFTTVPMVVLGTLCSIKLTHGLLRRVTTGDDLPPLVPWYLSFAFAVSAAIVFLATPFVVFEITGFTVLLGGLGLIAVFLAFLAWKGRNKSRPIHSKCTTKPRTTF